MLNKSARSQKDRSSAGREAALFEALLESIRVGAATREAIATAHT